MLPLLKKIEKDVWVVLFLIFISTYTIFNLKHWKKKNRIIVQDIVNYYAYLPATFIYGDVTLAHPNEKFNEFEHTFWYYKTKNGGKVFKGSMGMAILYSPFFFASHAYALITDEIASGFSPPYKFGLAMSSLFYLIIGFVFLRKLLRKFYTINVVALTLLFIGLGTNLYYYSVIEIGMPHVYLFSLFSITLYYIFKWYKLPSYKISILLGLLIGLMILVRPTMILILLFTLFFNINSLKLFKERMLLFKTHLPKILIIILCSFLVWIPQLLYWKATSGNYLFYPYNNEGFFFNDPQIINVLFSFRKGWLLYTPIMTFALIGLIMMFKKKEKMVFSISITVITYIYVISCWWAWWFGGSYGARPMIDMYPILAFGLAYFIQNIFNYSKMYKILLLSILFLLMGFNLFQTRQAHEGLLHYDSMTKAAYFKILFKLQKQITREEIKPYLKAPDYEAAKKGDRNQ